jgi:hypothetical protein
MLARQVGLIDQSGTVAPGTLAAVAAAISTQVVRDLSQFWPVNATVQALPADSGVPPGCIPAYIVSNLTAGTAGVHLSDNNQPFIKVEAGPAWMLAASHEVCETLVDPSLNQLHAATAIAVDDDGNVVDADGQFEYLVEICDPVGDPDQGYIIDGFPMADFYTPHYFDPVVSASVRYSFNGGVKGPRQVAKGGYLTWHDPVQKVWRMLDYLNYDPPQIVDVADMSAAGTLREKVDLHNLATRRLSATPPDHKLLVRAATRRHQMTLAAAANAATYGRAPVQPPKPRAKKPRARP